MAGPNINCPSANAEPLEEKLFKQAWFSYFGTVSQVLTNTTRSGTTAQRPTSAMKNRYVGMGYFDTTKGFMVWLKSTNPDVWVRYDGVAV